jgi:hypothetical protein
VLRAKPSMSEPCTSCARLHSQGAVICRHDEQAVERPVSEAIPTARTFPTALVLPSGTVCRDFDDLARACQEDWRLGRQCLQNGLFEHFLSGIGRADLALAAHAASRLADGDRALDQFLEQLGSSAIQPARLHVAQKEIDLGTIKGDANHHLELIVTNHGGRLLHGTVASDARWLVFADRKGAPNLPFQCMTEACIALRILSKKLRAGNEAIESRLSIDSNGGNCVVIVRAQVKAIPFAHGVLAGATTPRQFAEKARAFPREAAALFESGSVAAWYSQNGWTYPVRGPAATGLGAIQQFLEAIGLAKPPLLELQDGAVQLSGQPGQLLAQTIRLRASDKRPAFAHGISSAPWLTVREAEPKGADLLLPIRVAVPDRLGECLEARVTITANGGQQFDVPVTLAVTPPPAVAKRPPSRPAYPIARPATAGVVAQSPDRAANDSGTVSPPCRPQRLSVIHVLPIAALLTCLAVVSVRDILYQPPQPPVSVLVEHHPEVKTPAVASANPIFKVQVHEEPMQFDEKLTQPRPVEVKIVDERDEQPPPRLLPVKVEIKSDNEAAGDTGFAPGGVAFDIDPRPRLLCQFGPGMRWGITAVDTGKRLTYSPDGSTNQTMLRVNGLIGEFGGALGEFVERDVRLGPDPSRRAYGGSRSRWVSNQMHYVQLLEMVSSKQPAMVNGKLKQIIDTVRVQYLIENKSNRPMTVGLRCQVDTLIGSNDGVPFTIPGQSGGLVTQFADFPKAAPVPEFIQALERPNLQNPGTVAHMSLKIGGESEPPSRVSLTHWPGGGFPEYEVPLVPIQKDSAIVLYWADKPLQPGERRILGFAYGLGSVASSDPGGRLGITLGGNFEPGESFLATTYVQNPLRGQSLTLDLPPGLERIEGQATQNVPPPTDGRSIVTWRVKVLQTGSFVIKVDSSNGLSAAKEIRIYRPEGFPSAQLSMDLAGSFEPGQSFTVEAKLTSPDFAPMQLPALKLPEGLIELSGPVTKAAPGPDGKGSIATAVWKVQVKSPGMYPIRVSWLGAAVTKRLDIQRPAPPAGGYVTMRLEPPFVPGKAFGVIATVADPLAGQTLTLLLPPGLHLESGAETETVARETSGPSSVSWKVRLEKPGTFPLRLHSSTGLLLKKTLVVDQNENKGGGFTLEHAGEIAPGKEFAVLAKVTQPVEGQKLILHPLPQGLELVDGPEIKSVPPPGKDSPMSILAWRVRVVVPGTYTVRIASTTGVIRAFTIVLTTEQPEDTGPRIFGGKR